MSQSTAIQPFTFPTTGQPVRVVQLDGEPWFVAADVAGVLDLGNVHSSLALLDDDERCLHTVETGQRSMALVSEAGLYALVLRSRKTEAKAFRRWITHEVLPAIRRTGHYAPAAQFEIPQTLSAALRLAADEHDARLAAEARAAELEPAATAWNTLATADGDFDVAGAAKVLSRDPSIQLGRDRLFTVLAEQRWIFRDSGGRWAPYQAAVDRGRLSVLPQSHYHPRTGVLVLDPPQVRVTVKGLAELHRLLGGTAPLQLAEQLAIT